MRTRFALLKGSCGFGEEHEVVGQDTQDEFASLSLMSSGGECGAEATFVLAEATLDVPALVVEHARKALPEGSPVGRLRPAPAGVAAVQGDDAPADAEFLAAEAVVVLGIVAGIGQHRAKGHDARGLSHGGGEVRRVLAWADACHGANDQVRVDVEHRGQLGPGTLSMTQAFALAATLAEVLADMARFQPRGVDRRQRRGVDQAGSPGPPEDDHLGVVEDPPFSASGRRRRAA